MGLAPLERTAMRTLIVILAVLLAPAVTRATQTNLPVVVLVVGASGEPEYGSNFVQQVQLWNGVCDRADARVIRIGGESTNMLDDRETLKATLAAESIDSIEPLWLVLIGHGTFDGREARFNLRGPDVSSTELADWLKPMRRPLVLINCASASAPFLKALSGTNRVVVTATRSGNELNFSRFGEYFAKALADPASDLDKDHQVSLLEAFLVGSRQVAEFYQTEGRLMTEHALIDDNGDGLGTPADWFRGVHSTRKARNQMEADGPRAGKFCLVLSPEEEALAPEIRARRDALELEVERLRGKKAQMSEAEYYRQLEALFLDLARLQQAVLPSTNTP
jgi:hypothetical protein